MSSISENLCQLKNELPGDVTLIAVSKTKPVGDIQQAYRAGQRDFGENKAQEMEAKWKKLPPDIRWHMIGHLQRNKVKYIAPFVKLIHAVDSLRLLREINKQGANANRIIPCLLQVKIASEDSKYGLSEEDASSILQSGVLAELTFVSVRGLMGMATFTDDDDQIKREFNYLSKLYRDWKEEYDFSILSMGMSGDYAIAIENGSNMVRIGSAIFGERS